MIQVGTGGWGERWCKDFLPPNIVDGHLEVVAAVDIDPTALQNAKDGLGLRDHQCFTNIREAFDAYEADFCTVVVPPKFHEGVVDLALEHDLHILSEKPIADSLEASVRIADKVKRSGKKMAVTMSHRFDQDKTTLRTKLNEGVFGPLDYLVCRFTCDARKYATWSEFRHNIADPLMVEGAVHHLDLLADLAGSLCKTIYAQTWNPSWGEYAGDSQGLVVMKFDNGTHAVYEGAKTNAVGLNGWTQEYIRAECRDATVILGNRRLEAFPYNVSKSWSSAREGQGNEISLIEQKKWANVWLIEKYVDWLNGGETMETNVEANLQSVALIFAAIESSRTGHPVDVQAMLTGARDNTKI